MLFGLGFFLVNLVPALMYVGDRMLDVVLVDGPPGLLVDHRVDWIDNRRGGVF